MRVEIWVKFCHQQRFFFFLVFEPLLLQLFGMLLQHCFAVKHPKCFVNYKLTFYPLELCLNFYFSVNLSSNRETNTVLLKTKIFYHNSECNHRIVQILYDSRSNTPYRNNYLADLCQCNCVIWFHMCSISSLFFVTQ